MIEITKGLFLSSYWNISNESLIGMKIENVINISSVKFSFRECVKRVMEIEIEDSENTNISKYFTKTSRFICNSLINNENILVYCFAGMSRSPTIICAFLIKKRKMSYKEAVAYLSSKKRIDINQGFIQQLENI